MKQKIKVILGPARNPYNCSCWSVKTRGRNVRNLPTGPGFFVPFWNGKLQGPIYDVLNSAIDFKRKVWIGDLKEIEGKRYLKLFNALSVIKLSKHESRARFIEISL